MCVCVRVCKVCVLQNMCGTYICAIAQCESAYADVCDVRFNVILSTVKMMTFL